MSRRLSPGLSVIGIVIAMVVAACADAAPAAPTDVPPTSPPTTAAPAPTVAPTTAPAPTATAAPATAPVAGACEPSTETGTVTVLMQGFAFSPGRVRAQVGEVITFTNSDGAPHTATLDDGSCTTPTLGKDASGSLVFSAAGEYPFHCRIHPDMTGTFEVSG